jgi:hypothetical protein
MERPRPGSDGTERLTVRGTYAANRELHGTHTDVRYELHSNDDARHLEDVQWADWDAGGRLLVATVDGRLQIRDVDGSVTWQANEASLTPDPAPPPHDARVW